MRAAKKIIIENIENVSILGNGKYEIANESLQN